MVQKVNKFASCAHRKVTTDKSDLVIQKQGISETTSLLKEDWGKPMKHLANLFTFTYSTLTNKNNKLVCHFKVYSLLQ